MTHFSDNCLLKQGCNLIIACEFVIDACSVISALASYFRLCYCVKVVASVLVLSVMLFGVDRRTSCFMFSSAVSALYLTFFFFVSFFLFSFFSFFHLALLELFHIADCYRSYFYIA